MQKFSADLSELIGSVNSVEAAYKATILQNYVDIIKASDAIIPYIMSVAEQDLRPSPIIFDHGIFKGPDGKPILDITKKRMVLQHLLRTLHFTHAQVCDLRLRDDEMVEIIYENGIHKRLSAAGNSETEMISSIMKHI